MALGAPPSGVSSSMLPKVTGPNDVGWMEIRVGIGLTVITLTAVVLRFIARIVRGTRLEIDDWLAVVSMVSIIGMLIETILWAAVGGSGYHLMDVRTDPNTLTRFFKIFLANELTYIIANLLTKLTLLFLYRRLFAVRRFKQLADIITGLCVAWTTATFIVILSQCRPLASFWNLLLPGTCIDRVTFFYIVQGISVFLDLVILSLPMPMVWSLHCPRRDKLALSAIFMLGGFVCGASIYRLVALTKVDPNDITFSSVNSIITTFVEPCIGLVCACLPVIRGLFPTFSTLQSSNRTSSYYRAGNSKASYGSSYLGSRKSTPNNYFIHMESSYRADSLPQPNQNGIAVPNGRDIHVQTTIDVV